MSLFKRREVAGDEHALRAARVAELLHRAADVDEHERLVRVAAGADVAARAGEHDGTPLGWAEVSIDVTNNPKRREVVEYLASLEST